VAISAASLSAADFALGPGCERPSQDPQIDGVLDFTTAQIQNNFGVLRTDFKGKASERHGFIGAGLAVGKGFVWREVTLENGAFLDLRGAKVGGLCDDEKSWPIPGNLRIDGLSYGGFCGDLHIDHCIAAIEETASPRDVASRLRWLRLQPRFSPQPYKQLANWMRENGDDAGAEKVLAAKAAAESGGSGESGTFASMSLKRPLVAIIPLAFLFVMLVVLARAYFFGQRGAGALQPLRAAIEMYRHRGVAQRWAGNAESEEAPRLMRTEATTGSEHLGKSADGSGVFRREGEFWMLACRGKTLRLRNVKGLSYIAFLLAHPGERIHVHDLIASVEGVANPDSDLTAEISRELRATQELGDAGDALDQHAQADYRRRMRELAEDLAEAERLNDIGRTESIRHELEFLNGELSAAVGIGGRNRKAAAHVERARDMVGKNIRAGLRKIRNEDATLGHYFDVSIKTGYYCAYLPDPERKISWKL